MNKIEAFENYINSLPNLIPGILIFLSIAAVVMLFVVIYTVIKNTKTKKEWIKDIAIGDTCHIRVLDGSNVLDNCEITELSDDKVVVTFEISKRWISPPIPKK